MGRGTFFQEVMEKPTRAMGYKKFLNILKPYFVPKNLLDRIRASACFACLGAAKVCSIMGPVYLGNATDQLAAGHFPVKALILFCSLAFGSKGFNELQRIIYLRVKEVAGVELAETVRQTQWLFILNILLLKSVQWYFAVLRTCTNSKFELAFDEEIRCGFTSYGPRCSKRIHCG